MRAISSNAINHAGNLIRPALLRKQRPGAGPIVRPTVRPTTSVHWKKTSVTKDGGDNSRIGLTPGPYTSSFCNVWYIMMQAGPSVTSSTDGKIRKNTGKISFTPTFRAASCACWRKRVRK